MFIINNSLLFILQSLLSSFDHQLSADKKYLLLALNYQKVSVLNFWQILNNREYILDILKRNYMYNCVW